MCEQFNKSAIDDSEIESVDAVCHICSRRLYSSSWIIISGSKLHSVNLSRGRKTKQELTARSRPVRRTSAWQGGDRALNIPKLGRYVSNSIWQTNGQTDTTETSFCLFVSLVEFDTVGINLTTCVVDIHVCHCIEKDSVEALARSMTVIRESISQSLINCKRAHTDADKRCSFRE